MATPATPSIDSRLLAELTACAGGFAQGFAELNDAANTPAERVAAFELFDRAFRAVRLGAMLMMRIEQPVVREPRQSEAEVESEAERAETRMVRPDTRIDRERETDRESESVSLPEFLKTLGIVERETAALAVPLPPALGAPAVKTLTHLLDRAGRPAPAPTHTRRANLAAGSATITLAPLTGLAGRRRPP